MILVTNADSWIVLQAGPVGPKLLAVKFLETYVLRFTLDSNDFEKPNPEGNHILINNSMSGLDFGNLMIGHLKRVLLLYYSYALF